jgi:ribosomal protein L37AE/L43A
VNRKLCGCCGGYSYSAIHSGEWKCPYCGNDLTDVEIDREWLGGGLVARVQQQSKEEYPTSV